MTGKAAAERRQVGGDPSFPEGIPSDFETISHGAQVAA
jgi:hypothetical protein